MFGILGLLLMIVIAAVVFHKLSYGRSTQRQDDHLDIDPVYPTNQDPQEIRFRHEVDLNINKTLL